MAKKIYKFENITLFVEASTDDVAVTRLNNRLNRLVNRDVTYNINGDLKGEIISSEERNNFNLKDVVINE